MHWRRSIARLDQENERTRVVVRVQFAVAFGVHFESHRIRLARQSRRVGVYCHFMTQFNFLQPRMRGDLHGGSCLELVEKWKCNNSFSMRLNSVLKMTLIYL